VSEVVSDRELDVSAILTSGQVFRFGNPSWSDSWCGVDGSNVIEATRDEGGWRLSSRPDGSAYKRLFRLECDMAKIRRAIGQADPRFRPMLKRNPGLRVIHCSRADETLFSFLCTANNHLPRITRMVRCLAALGAEIEPGMFVFPEPPLIAAVPEKDLRMLGFGYRAGSIAACARVLSTRGVGWLEGLREGSYADAHAALCELPGVGPKIADCVCLFGLHFDEAVPLDVHLWRAAAQLYEPELVGTAITPQRYRRVSTTFRDIFGIHAGWAQQFLFYEAVSAKYRAESTY
jgi:N-glycosylase/DNA lyase